MNEQELADLVESRLAERLAARDAAERERVRWEVILELRREASRAHYDRINARHPVMDPLAGLTQEQENERQRQMADRSAATTAKMDTANSRPVPGQVAHSLRTKRVDAVGGGSGFKIR